MKTALLFLALLPMTLFGQLTDYIYCINNPSIGEFNIAKIHLPTGEMTEFDDIANSISSFYSTSINIDSEDFYFCDGYNVHAFDTQTESLEAPITLPLALNSSFHQMQYNPCDSSLYGVVAQNNFNAFSFERFDLNSLQFETIAELPSNYYSCGDCISALDPANNVFVVDHGGVSGLDLSNGEEVIDTSPTNPPGYSFGHMSYKCTTQEVFGTLANLNQETKQMGSVNLTTGAVSSLSDSNWSVGFWKPYGGGNVIDQGTGVYYYSGAGGLLIGASTVTGQLVYNEDVSSGEIFFLQHFSQCPCPNAVGIEDSDLRDLSIEVYPNPVSETLTVSSTQNELISYSIRDVMGRSVLQGNFRAQLVLDTQVLDDGTYLCEFRTGDGLMRTIKVLKN